MKSKPQYAISLRQPWAWLVVNGYKTIENRKWKSKFRGPVLVHAAAKMSPSEYETCAARVREINPSVELPALEELLRGGIVGQMEVIDCVSESNDPWFTGPYGFTVRSAKTLPFKRCKGQLFFFEIGA